MTARAALALLTVLALAGCGSSPPTHFFALTEEPSSLSCPSPHGPPVVVRQVAIPDALDRSAIVTELGGGQVAVAGTDRWIAPLDGMIQSVLTADLRQRLGDAAVLAPGDPAPPSGVRSVRVNVQRFSADAAGRVTLAADYAFQAPNATPVGGPHHARFEVNAGSAKAAAVVPAMSRALGRLADSIATDLAPGCRRR